MLTMFCYLCHKFQITRATQVYFIYTFDRFTRMTPERFDHLHSLVKDKLDPKNRESGNGPPIRGRRPICSKEKLALTIRYLATGDSQQSASFNFRMGRSTVSNIIKEVCAALWEVLSSTYLKFPSTVGEWQQISDEFMENWDLPHVLGAIDGKHVRMDCPKFGGSLYYNYKGFHSTVMMAICDANYRFIYVSIGSYGRDNDASIFSRSDIYDRFDNNAVNTPNEEPLNAGAASSIPYFLVGDEIFALKNWLMKPFPGRGLSERQKTFNYRLSRARRTIENAFGILSARFRVFMRPIRADVSTVDSIVKATVCLHNYLLCTDNARYIPSGFVDTQSNEGFADGDWRQLVRDDANPALANAGRIATRNYNFDAKSVREKLADFVMSPTGRERCPWQHDHVTSTGKAD